MAQHLPLQILRRALHRQAHHHRRAARIGIDIVGRHIGIELRDGDGIEGNTQLLGDNLAERRARPLTDFDRAGEQNDAAVGVHLYRRG